VLIEHSQEESITDELELVSKKVTSVTYHIGSRAIELPLPEYRLKIGTIQSQPALSVSTKDGRPTILQLEATKLRIHSEEPSFKGKQVIVITATD
jgi:hypothetical protein